MKQSSPVGQSQVRKNASLFPIQKRQREVFFTGLSLIALAVSSAVNAQTAPASPAAAPDTSEIVITGSRIRGVAPVGSPVIALGREEMEASGVANTNDFLRQVPQVTNYGADDSLSGGTAVQNSILNISLARSINLRGLGTASTLTLINGHRIAPGGPNAAFIDADSVPALAVQRMEVVADGASAIYGSDAVAGVVNIMTRKSFEGAEATVRYGKSKGTSQWLASAILGKLWDTGGATLTLEKSRRNALAAKDRASLYNDNLAPFGAANGSFQAAPGNITVAGVNYGIPSGNGQNFTLGQLTSTSNIRSAWDGGREVTPRQERETVVFTADQELNKSSSVFLEALNSDRKFSIVNTSGAGANLSISALNPNSPCFAGKVTTNAFGIGCAANLSVPYSFINEMGAGVQSGYSKAWDVTAGIKFAITGDWKGEASVTKSKDSENRDSFNITNANALALVSSGAATFKGVAYTKPANVPFLNPFCDGSKFTCNDPATIAFIKGFSHQGSVYNLTDYNIKADGTIFTLPGGNVKLAVGAEYHKDAMANYNENTTGGPSVADYTSILTSAKRNVISYFAEAYIPIVGEKNASAGFQRLDLSIAGRSEKYSDFGNSRNPKIGVTWVPVKGLEFTSTYGTSFRAPTLCDINPDCTARVVNGANFSTADIATIAAANAGSVGVTGTKNFLQTGGGTTGLVPEKAKTFSLGFNIHPSLLKGVDLGVNYYKIKYTNRIGTPGEQITTLAAFTQSIYAPFIELNPAYFPVQAANNPTAKTQAQFNALTTAIANNPALTTVFNAANVLGVVNGNRLNTGTVDTDGLDLSGSYNWNNAMGEWRIGGTGTYVTSFKTSDSNATPLADKVNKFTYPLRFKARGELGWRGADWSATGFLNYSNAYTIETAFLPNVTNKSDFTNINSYTTADLTINYNSGKQQSTPMLSDIRVGLNIQNLFDKAPPLVLNGTNLRFDPQNASATGRYTSLQVTKTW